MWPFAANGVGMRVGSSFGSHRQISFIAPVCEIGFGRSPTSTGPRLCAAWRNHHDLNPIALWENH
jgi:hypothetical protein